MHVPLAFLLGAPDPVFLIDPAEVLLAGVASLGIAGLYAIVRRFFGRKPHRPAPQYMFCLFLGSGVCLSVNRDRVGDVWRPHPHRMNEPSQPPARVQVKKLFIAFLVVGLLVGCAKKTEIDRTYEEFIANAKSEKEKQLARFEYRMLKFAEAHGDVAPLFQPQDGIDQFEALLLAKDYFSWQFGVCGFVDLPEKQGETWVVKIAAGREGKREPPIFIDARTGNLHCEGHPSITDAIAFLKSPKPPEPPLGPTR